MREPHAASAASQRRLKSRDVPAYTVGRLRTARAQEAARVAEEKEALRVAAEEAAAAAEDD
jgi:hypothetical protein